MTSRERDPLRRHRLLIDACLKHGVPFFWHGPGTFLISGNGVRDVLAEVYAAKEEVLGLEGFELESTVIHPRLDLIWDSKGAWRGGPSVVTEAWGKDIWVHVELAKRAR